MDVGVKARVEVFDGIDVAVERWLAEHRSVGAAGLTCGRENLGTVVAGDDHADTSEV